jgi:ABC-2 type transport system ATP-binding protein
MKQRLGIAAALLGDPELLVLDEPSNGLDPAGIAEMRRLIAEVGSGHRTVFVSSHILGELEQVCDWLVVIDCGSLVYQGSAEGFVSQAAPTVTAMPERAADLDRLAAIVRARGLAADRDGGELLVSADDRDPRAVAAEVNRAAIADGLVLAELHVRRPDLDSHYLALLEGADR